MIHRDLILPVPVLLIDDQVEASLNLSHILQNFGYPKEVLLCSSSLANAVSMVQQHLPNLVFINLQSWFKAQIDFIQNLKLFRKDTLIVAVLPSSMPKQLLQAIHLGISAYVFSDQTATGMQNQIRTILRGGSPLDGNLANEILACEQSIVAQGHSLALSKTEHEILSLSGQGLPSQQVAANLNASEQLVHGYVKSIYRKIMNADDAMRCFS